MIDFLENHFYRLRFIAAGILIIICLLLTPLVFKSIFVSAVAHAQEANADPSPEDLAKQDSPNVITRGMFNAADKIGQITGSAGEAVNNSLSSIKDTTVTAAAQTGEFVAHGLGGGISATGHAAGSGATLAIKSAGNVFGLIAKASAVGAIIRPADKTPLPVIDSDVVLAESKPAQSPPSVAQPQVDSGASWPLRGEITEEFGVPHWPFQPIHTGIDISDGGRAGVTPIRPFKSGRVIEAVHSSVGFGNHVIIDHGGGIVSLYGHLASISVSVGQQVDKNTVVGYEGSTGASTGTHLHFEIRLNGQPVNPHQYVSGNPS